MKKEDLIELMMAFFICTACICILSAVLGTIFFPEDQFGYEAMWSPPFFGAISAVLGLVTKSRKELSVRQVAIRNVLHLVLIECVVFGMNYLAGVVFEMYFSVILAFAIAVVFAAVHLIMYISDSRDAHKFNEQLKQYQQSQL